MTSCSGVPVSPHVNQLDRLRIAKETPGKIACEKLLPGVCVWCGKTIKRVIHPLSQSALQPSLQV